MSIVNRALMRSDEGVKPENWQMVCRRIWLNEIIDNILIFNDMTIKYCIFFLRHRKLLKNCALHSDKEIFHLTIPKPLSFQNICYELNDKLSSNLS